MLKISLNIWSNCASWILDAQPTEAEKEVYDEAQVVLQRAHRILQELQDYKGASQEIRKAIGTPDTDTEKQAWEAVLPLVTKLKDFYLFSKELGILVFLELTWIALI